MVYHKMDGKYSQFYRSFTHSLTIFIILQSFNPALRFEVLIVNSTTNTEFQTLILLTRTRFMIGHVELLIKVYFSYYFTLIESFSN